MKPLADCRLYTFVDAAYLAGRSLEDVARQLCDGGSDLIQLRAKNHPAEQIRNMARRLWPLLQAANVGLVINDHPEIAAAIGAPLCHLGQEDFFDAGYVRVSELRARLRPRASAERLGVGLSTHAPAQAEKAVAAGPDYIAIGPVYATGTKPTARPVTLEYVRWAAAQVKIPWFAIGGINLQNLDAVLEAGARRVCAVSAILNAPDLVKACHAFKERILSAGRDDGATS